MVSSCILLCSSFYQLHTVITYYLSLTLLTSCTSSSSSPSSWIWIAVVDCMGCLFPYRWCHTRRHRRRNNVWSHRPHPYVFTIVSNVQIRISIHKSRGCSFLSAFLRAIWHRGPPLYQLHSYAAFAAYHTSFTIVEAFVVFEKRERYGGSHHCDHGAIVLVAECVFVLCVHHHRPVWVSDFYRRARGFYGNDQLTLTLTNSTPNTPFNITL